MTAQPAFLTASLADYIDAHSSAPDPLERELIAHTQTLTGAGMQIGATQARAMAVLTRVLRPRLIVELGTFTGLSALVMAKELSPGAKLITCDIDPVATATARDYWDRAGVGDRIELRLGPATETLAQLQADHQDSTPVDLAFIDADKGNYLAYLELLVPMLGDRSVVLVDNVLWDGRVADDTIDDETTSEIRAFNTAVVNDDRFAVAMLAVGDGLSMITLA